jgi:hypothetical protein
MPLPSPGSAHREAPRRALSTDCRNDLHFRTWLGYGRFGLATDARRCALMTGAAVALLMAFAAVVPVVQLAALGTWARSLRILTIVQTISVGFLVVAPLTVGLQWLVTRSVAAAGLWTLAEVVDIAGWTIDPALEELLKVAPLILLAWLWPRIGGQLGLVDHLLVGAGTGAGFALAEGVLRYGQVGAMATAIPGGYLADSTLSGAIVVPSVWVSLTAWLPAPVSFDWPAISGAQHLVWTALAAAGVGWFTRRRPKRWLGLLPVALVSLAHANYNAAHSLSGMAWAWPVLTWVEQRLAGLLVLVLIGLVVADRISLTGARRSRPELLLRGERADGLGPWPLVKVAGRGLPWSAFVSWQVVLERRAALNAQVVGVPPPELAHEVERWIDQLQRSTDRARWVGAAKEVFGSLSLRGLRSWRTLLWLLSVIPAVFFLIVGGWPGTRGLQELAGTWFGTGLVLLGLGLGGVLVIVQMPTLVRRISREPEPTLHESKIRPGFRLATAGASLVAAVLLGVALFGGGDPSGRIVRNYHVLDALSSAELWLGLAIILLSFLLFPPAAALVVTTLGTVMVTSSGVALAVGSVVGATLVSHALLNAASGSGSSSNSGGGSHANGSPQGPLQEPGVAENVLATPQVSSPKLQNLVNNLYKGTANPNRVGNGTTMDAIRNELATGVATSKRFHTIKGTETLQGLKNWLRRSPDAPFGDKQIAQSLIDDLTRALKGKR